MEDKLKTRIEQDTAPLETAPPTAWDAIAERLDAEQQHEKRTLRLHTFRRIAAAVALLLALGGVLWLSGGSEPDFATRYPELTEATQFYEQVLQQKEQAIQQKVGEAAYEQEMALLKADYQRLKESLKGNTNREQIINSMIQNYRLRVELLERLLQQINNQEKDENEPKDKIS